MNRKLPETLSASSTDNLRKLLASRVRAARAYANLTQPELGKMIGLSHHSVRRMERGERDPTERDLLGVGAACGVPVSFMLNGWPSDEAAVDGDSSLRLLVHNLEKMVNDHEAMLRSEVRTAKPRPAQRRRAS
jgi:transcriptional regulator with XRE-family HTH domain